jgi:hypothetical protein
MVPHPSPSLSHKPTVRGILLLLVVLQAACCCLLLLAAANRVAVPLPAHTHPQDLEDLFDELEGLDIPSEIRIVSGEEG